MNEVPKEHNTARERKSLRWSLEAFQGAAYPWVILNTALGL